MIRLLVFLLQCFPLVANNALWMDLSGEWRHRSGVDRPEFSNPDFDDRAWPTLYLPPRELTRVSLNRGWIRKRVPLPPGVDRSQLALTLGTIGNYELYVNGQLVGSTTARGIDNRLKRPLTFPLPVIQGPDLVIAVRSIRTFGRPMWMGYDRGPWLLTYMSHAPYSAGEHAMNQLKLENVPSFVLTIVYLAIGLVSLASWFADRVRMELFWFALLALMRCTEGTLYLAGSAGDWPIASNEAVAITYIRSTLAVPLHAELVLAVIGWGGRWWHVALVLWAVISSLGISLLPEQLEIMIGTQFFGAILILGVILWRSRRGAFLTIGDGLLRLALMVPCLFWIANAGPGFRGKAGTLLVQRWGYRWSTYEFAYLAVSAMIVVLLINRMLLERRQRQHLASELEAAGIIQRMLLGHVASQPDRLAVDAVYRPAQEVGGDFYYVLDGRTVIVGDVSGKGLRAAMLVSLLLGALRTTTERAPGKILGVLHMALAGRTDGAFVTCCCVDIAPSGEVVIANAGHLAPWLDGVELELPPALPLGILADSTWEDTRFPAFGGQLTLMSDGVPEASNEKGELLGFDRTRELAERPALVIAEAAQAWGQNDDITVVTLRRAR